MSGRAIDHVAIVGRGADLWLTACVLRRALGLEVTAIALPGVAGLADVHATQPAIEALHNRIGIDEAALIRRVGGAYTLGQNFTEPGGAHPPFLHAYGAYGRQIEGRAFFHYWLKARRHGLDVAFEEFSPTAVAARHGRLPIPDDRSLSFGRSDYGYHLPAKNYAAALRDVATRIGVRSITADCIGIDAAEEGIAAITVDGEQVTAGLLVDASGDGELIDAAGQADRVDWSDQFPADRVLTALAPPLSSLPIYADIRSGPGGWTGLYPALAGTFILHAFSSRESNDAAAAERAVVLAGVPIAEIRVRPSLPGRTTAAWRGNCVAVGQTAARFDPVHGVDLHALQQQLVNLLSLFPTTTGFAPHRMAFNRFTASAFDRIRDFQAAHYRLARYAGPFWDRARAMAATPELAHQIDTFRAGGAIAPWEDESFSPDSWRALFVGHGVLPDTHSPLIDRIPPDMMKRHFRDMLAFVREEVLRHQTHDDHLSRVLRRASP